MNKLFGANWRTTLWGGLRAIMAGIVTGAIVFPADWRDPKQDVLFLCVLLATGAGIKFALVAKDKDVTNGTIVQDASGDVDRVATMRKEVLGGTGIKPS